MTKINQNLANQKEYLSVSDMADEFGIHEMTFYRMIRDKKIPAFKIGSQWRVKRSDLERWLEARCSMPAPNEP
jgi:excisionase family DNA binding protein